MLDLVIKGIIFGALLSFSLGPVFFELIDTSLRKGFRSAFYMDIGVLISDIIYLIIAFFSAQQIVQYINENQYFKYIAGGVFILFGVFSIIKKRNQLLLHNDTHPDKETLDLPVGYENIKHPFFRNIFKGIALNAINPSVILFWIAVCSSALSRFGTQKRTISFFIITLITMFAIDIIKIYFASKLKKMMTPKALFILGVVVGCIMIALGIILMFIGISKPDHIKI